MDFREWLEKYRCFVIPSAVRSQLYRCIKYRRRFWLASESGTRAQQQLLMAGGEEGGVMIIETARLRLRPLTDADMDRYLIMAADPEVTRYVSPSPIPRAHAEAAAKHYRRQLETKGYGYWAIEVKGGSPFGGIILLQDVKFTAAFTPAIEVGWLLPREHWGNGYATEGGRAVLDYAFTTMKLAEIVALTAAGNIPPQRVMQRLGMTHDPHDDFDHPHALGTPLQRCVLCRIQHP